MSRTFISIYLFFYIYFRAASYPLSGYIIHQLKISLTHWWNIATCYPYTFQCV